MCCSVTLSLGHLWACTKMQIQANNKPQNEKTNLKAGCKLFDNFQNTDFGLGDLNSVHFYIHILLHPSSL